MSTTIEPRLWSALARLAPHEHLCAISESEEEELAVAVAFLRMGVDRGETCVYIADEGTLPILREAMGGAGVDVERAVAKGELVLEARERWAQDAGGLERWREYESGLSRRAAEQKCTVLCQYDRRVCPPELILDVIRTHPTVIVRGTVCRNFYHVPPEELLGAKQPARAVDRLLSIVCERELAEQKLRESEALFRQIAETIREVFWVWDVGAGRVRFVSPTYEDVFGRSRDSLYADFQSFLAAIHADDRPRVVAAVARQRAGTATDEQYRVVKPDGSMRWVRDRGFPVREPGGSITHVVGVAEDITDSKHTEDGLRRSEGLLRQVLDAMPVGVAVMDERGDIVLSNPASQRVWGGPTLQAGRERYPASKGWWHDTGKKLAPGDWASVRALSRGEVSIDEVIDIEAYDGARKTIRNSAIPIRDADGGIMGAIVVNEDVSAREAADRALKDSYNQLRTLTARLMRAQDDERRRIALMLHESTAQDLAALKMLLARLNRTPDSLGETERQVLAESIALADHSMKDIRTLSYLLHPPFLDEMGLASAIRWYAAGFAERSGIEVALDLPEGLERPSPEAETALFRIVQEALINIFRHAESKTARIRVKADAGKLVLEIEDRGPGISSDVLGQILSGGGIAGVGIAGMSERIRQLGGRLDVDSGAGGTTVRAELPLAKAVA